MADQVCLDRGIPTCLHTEGRSADQAFEASERLFRRFNGTISDENLSEIISFDVGESTNREKYSLSAADALFNTRADKNEGAHYHGWAVFAFTVGQLEGRTWLCDDKPSEIYTFKIEHKPERCMYPHSQILAFVNGQPVTTGLRKALRRKVRSAIIASTQKQILRGLIVPSE